MMRLSSFVREQLEPTVKVVAARLKPLQRGASVAAFMLHKTPKRAQKTVLEPIMNHALAVLIDSGELDYLVNKSCSIAVKNTDQQWVFSLDEKKLMLLDQPYADVTVSATIPAFFQLMSQQADPDALFFKRELSIEGDVELGLYVKNMLDALDEDDLSNTVRAALSHLRRLLSFEVETAN